MQNSTDVSVIICAYTEERWDDLIAAVASVQQQSMLPYEIIVVIDHNPILFERAYIQFPGVIVIENKQQRGLSGARNSGIEVACGQIIAFMDEDAVADNMWLAHLVAGYRDSNVLGVGGEIIPQWQSGRPKWFPPEFDWVVGCTYKGMPETTTPVRNLIGCNMSFRREVFVGIGGFRNGIGRVGTRPVGCEETELCIRIHQAYPQSLLHYEPLARVLHRVPSSRSTLNYFRARCYAEGLSKALVTESVGTGDGLASERTYTLQALPRGVIRGISDSLIQRSSTGIRCSCTIVAGLVITTVGYCIGSVLGKTQYLQHEKLKGVAIVEELGS